MSLFVRHRFVEHLKLNGFVSGFWILLGLGLVVLTKIEPELLTKPASWIETFGTTLASFVSKDKVVFVGTTLLIAVFINLFHESIVVRQTKRTKISPNKLAAQLCANSYGVCIAMCNSLGLIVKVGFGFSILMLILFYAGIPNEASNPMLYVINAAAFLFTDVSFFIVQKCVLRSETREAPGNTSTLQSEAINT